MDQTQNMTVGVVGLGEIGLLYAELAQSFGCTVIGADADAYQRSQFKQQTGAETHEDFQVLFERDLDFVIVCVPNKFKEVVGTAALDSGLDVYFEKPLAHNLESAQRIVDAHDQDSSVCMVGYYHPFYDPVVCLAEYLDSGELGDITHIDARFTHRRWVPNRGSWYTSRDIAGGGVLQDKGSFMMSILHYFGFESIETVTATTRTEFVQQDEYVYLEMWGGEGHENVTDVEDSATAFIEFECGTTATINVAWAVNTAPENTYRLHGPEGGAFLDLREPTLTLYRSEQGPPDRIIDQQIDVGVNEQYLNNQFLNDPELQRDQLARYIEHVRDRTQPTRSSLTDALQVQRMVEQIYDAANK